MSDSVEHNRRKTDVVKWAGCSITIMFVDVYQWGNCIGSGWIENWTNRSFIPFKEYPMTLIGLDGKDIPPGPYDLHPIREVNGIGCKRMQ